jgi:carboxylesterase type B
MVTINYRLGMLGFLMNRQELPAVCAAGMNCPSTYVV